MKSISVSAPGKLMLLGEHAVVYNRPCLVTAVGQRMKAVIYQTKEKTFELHAEHVNIVGYKKPMEELGKGDVPKGVRFVETAVRNFCDEYPLQGGVKIITTSEFSSQFGFGSSSASTVCVLRALMELYSSSEVKRSREVSLNKNEGSRLRSNNKMLFDLAYKTVLDIQGKGSGFDVAAAIYGGCLYFVTGGKVIEPLEVKHLPLIVGYSGVKADSVTLMNQVKAKAQKYPEFIESVYTEVAKLVEKAKATLLTQDFSTFGELMNFNQGLLESMGVSTVKLSGMIYAARNSGAYGAKLSGAGGGDCMIAVAPDDKMKSVKNAIAQVGGRVVEVATNVEGVRVEK